MLPSTVTKEASLNNSQALMQLKVLRIVTITESYMGHLYQLLTPKAKEAAQKRDQKECGSQNTSAVKCWLLGTSSELY